MLQVAEATCATDAKRSGLGPVGLRMRRLGCGDSDTWGDGDSASESPHPSRGGNAEQRIGARRGGARGSGRPILSRRVGPPAKPDPPAGEGRPDPPAKYRTGTGKHSQAWTTPIQLDT